MQKHIVVLTAIVEPIDGSSMAAAIHQGYGREFIEGYFKSKMPAGSPVTIQGVTVIPESK
jgi:hypothetical protein